MHSNSVPSSTKGVVGSSTINIMLSHKTRRTAPIARLRPFDVTVCTSDDVMAGGAVYALRDGDASRGPAKYMENGTFAQVQAFKSPFKSSTSIEAYVSTCLEYGGDAALQKFKEDLHDNVSHDDEKWMWGELVGFAITDAEKVVVSSRRNGNRSKIPKVVPITIAGAMTILRDEFFRILFIAIADPTIGTYKDVIVQINNQMMGRTLKAGAEFLVHSKKIRVQESVKILNADERDRVRDQPSSITIIVSTLSS